MQVRDAVTTAVRRELPPTVIDGVVQYWSASSLTLGDPTTSEGCPRKWYYEKVLDLRPPQTMAQSAGVELHAQNEAYLRTGANGLGSLAMRGKHMLPAPGPDLFVEHDIVVPVDAELVARDAEQDGRPEVAAQVRAACTLADAPLRLLGIPVVGYIDLLHDRCVNQGTSDPSDAVDPPGTVEVCDWKTSSSAEYTKSPLEVSRTTQMTTYGAWVLTQYPGVTGVRLSHGYYYTKGGHLPRKVSLRVLPDSIVEQCRRVERVADSLVEAAATGDVSKVKANRSACGAYGGCPHRSYCTAGAESGLAKYFGAAGARRIAESVARGTRMTTESKRPSAGLAFGRKKEQVTSTPPSDDAITSAQSTTATTATSDEVAKAAKDLAREEAQAAYPDLELGWDALAAAGLGTPRLEGVFAQAVSDLYGLELDGEGRLPGTGELEQSGPFADPAILQELVEGARELAEERRVAASIKVVPDGVDDPAPQPIVQETSPAPATVSSPAVQEPSKVQEPAPAPRKRGRPPKVKQEPIPASSKEIDPSQVEVSFKGVSLEGHVSDGTIMSVDRQGKVENLTVDQANARATSAGFNVDPQADAVAEAFMKRTAPEVVNSPVRRDVFFYLDCTPSCAFKSFHPRVDEVLCELAAEAKLSHIGSAPASHDLGFGRWKYALELALKLEELPPGHWVYRSSGTEVSQIVVDAMRSLVTKQGGVFVEP